MARGRLMQHVQCRGLLTPEGREPSCNGKEAWMMCMLYLGSIVDKVSFPHHPLRPFIRLEVRISVVHLSCY